jgi:hypothetical protein
MAITRRISDGHASQIAEDGLAPIAERVGSIRAERIAGADTWGKGSRHSAAAILKTNRCEFHGSGNNRLAQGDQ